MLSRAASRASAISRTESSGSITPRDTSSGPARTAAVSRSAVDRNEETRPDGVEHLTELIALGVAGDMHVANLRVKDASAVAIEVVHGLVDHALVARDWSRRDHHPIVLAHVQKRMPLRRES